MKGFDDWLDNHGNPGIEDDPGHEQYEPNECPECGAMAVIYGKQISADYCVACGWTDEQ